MSPYVQELVIFDPHPMRVLQGTIDVPIPGLHVGQLILYYAVLYLGPKQAGEDL